jgi:hypothetical protein
MGRASTIRMTEIEVKISKRKIGNSSQETRDSEVSRPDRSV